MDPFIGQLLIFAGNFAPQGWAFCNGQLLSIPQNQALFSLLGVTYGGNGTTTFGLPDLRGRFPVHPGSGPGLAPIQQGEMDGAETHTMSVNEMPLHNHTMHAELAGADKQTPQGNMLGLTSASNPIYAAPNPAEDRTMAPGSIGTAGGSQPFSIRNPYLGINFIIALEGIYPSRG
ncbi:phage tail protein [Pelagerythrobacter sp.]|uniref:phage tail protein n=1 Tax=Pelagerythrobacter sp. TaxID=2800702 RepID=UPI0035B49AD1